MRLKGHMKIGLSCGVLAFSITTNFIPEMSSQMLTAIILAVFIGNIGPDISEFGIIEHRTYTHYPPFYISIILIFIFLLNYKHECVFDYSWPVILFSYCVGCTIHLMCDIPYGGLPYIFPTRKVTILKIPLVGVLNNVIETSLVLFILYLSFIFY